MYTFANIDRAAATLSLVCIVHCVALPMMAMTLPFIAALAEAEWVHFVLVLLAILTSSAVVVTAHDDRTPVVLIPMALGMGFIASALFADQFGGNETVLTVIGGVLLAMVHIRRLYKYA